MASTLSMVAVVMAPEPVGAATPAVSGSIAAGNVFTCGVTQGGGVKCWGNNGSGQLGNGSATASLAPVDVSGLGSGVASVATGADHACAVMTAGGVKCWGANGSGQLGNGSTANSAVPVNVSGLTSGVESVSIGLAHSCAVTTAGGLKCWGGNGSGQLGTGSTAQSTTPVDVSGFTSGVASVSAGGFHSCAVTTAGGAKCWGDNGSGQLGTGSTAQSTTPVDVSGFTSGVASVSAGVQSSCAVTTAGAVKCWGSNYAGQLGNGSTVPASSPVNVTGLASGAVSVSVGLNHSCALMASGGGKCWGANGSGQLGTGTLARSTTPVEVLGWSAGLASISTGWTHTCAVAKTGAARCWGTNDYGEVGYVASSQPSSPVDVAGLPAGVASVAAGGSHSCAVTTAGAVKCWGANTTGQTGNGTTSQVTAPANVIGLTSGVASVATGANHSCAVTTAGAVKCWGANTTGQLGNGTTTPSSRPVDVIGLASGVASVSAGETSTCAVTTAGAVKCWGSGSNGQLGNGSTSTQTVPVDVTGLSSGAVSVSTGGGFSCAVVSGGAKCWGTGSNGQMGDGTRSSSSTPVDVTGLTSEVVSVAAGTFHACAVTTAGAAKCWGNGTGGRLGNNSAGTSLTPIAVTGLSSGVASITSGSGHSCATTTAGAVKCWGANTTGQLGTGSNTAAFTPVAVVGLSSGAAALSAGTSHSCVVTAAGAAKCWGSNATMQATAAPMYAYPNEVGGGFLFGPLQPPAITGSRSPAANANGWNNEPVTVSFTCSSTALASCTSPVRVTTDGANQSVTGTATDAASQSASATVSGISIDRVAPTLAGLASSAPNAAGWYDAPVSMAWTCDDALSGVAPGACPGPTSTVGEGSAVSVSASVLDKAGNQATASSESVKVDLTKPSTGVSSPPTWSSRDVTLTLSPSDGLSGVASTSYTVDGGATQTGTAPVVSGQGVHTVEFWSTDVAGNIESPQSVQVRIDVQAPSITASRSVEPNAAGWNKGPVTVSFDCGDAGGSGVASCSAPQAFTTEVDTSVTGSATDNAGNTASVQVPVRIDRSAPKITAAVPPANGAGWFNTSVQVPFSCSDTGGSGIDTCPEPAVFAGEGAGQAVNGTAIDVAGNTGSTGGTDSVSIDLTAPTITGAVIEPGNGSGGFYGTVHVHWTCDDALSGVAACPADETVSGEGVHVVSASVNDVAGNTSTAEVTVRIDHDTTQDPGTIHGTLTDQVTGQPAPGVQIAIFKASTGAQVAATTTGTDGTWVFPIVADGSYKLAATKWGTYLQRWYPATNDIAKGTAITVVHGTNATADMAISPGHVVKGAVTGQSGSPIGGATVVLSNGTQAKTDASGAYEIKGVASAAYTYRVIAMGYVTGTGSLSLNGTTTSTNVLDKQLAAQPLSTGMKGTITSLTPGGPLAGATVRIWAKDAMSFSLTVTTGANGRFELPNLPAGDYQVDVVRGDYAVRWAADAAARTGAATITLTTACTSTPDTTWGSACANPVNIRMRKPGT